MSSIVENITRILADWNPLDVPEFIAIEEYKGYTPSILRSIERQELSHCLEDILINQLEIDYDSMNKEHLEDLQQICIKIMEAYQKTNK
jgi:hypothetical protein